MGVLGMSVTHIHHSYTQMWYEVVTLGTDYILLVFLYKVRSATLLL